MMVSKYDASGNDFVIFHTFTKKARHDLAKRLCDRHCGIGADGMIVLVPHPGYDFEWEFYNSDGSDAEMCGNGSRAAAHYAYVNGLAQARMKFLTLAGTIEASVEGETAEVKLTEPRILDEVIVEEGLRWKLIDTGVPHLVTFVEDLKAFDPQLARRMRERYNANVNFAKIDDKERAIYVRTYERGVEAETLACGTGMAASFYAAFLEGKVDHEAKVYPASRAQLTLRLDQGAIFFKGSVHRVFETSVDL